MTIGHLLDHACDVWRLTESLDSFRATVNSYERVYQNLPCTFKRRNTLLSNDLPGLRAVGERTIYLDTGPAFQERDLVVLITGPTGFVGPQPLEVESLAVPRGHHIELRGTEFKGPVPQEVIPS